MKFGEINYIYAIRHNPTRKLYIGCSSNSSRINSHLSALKSGRHSNSEMQADADKYGCDFTVYLLEIVKRRGDYERFVDPHAREEYWIHYYCTDDPRKGYNSPRIYRRTRISEFPVIANSKELEVIIGNAESQAE